MEDFPRRWIEASSTILVYGDERGQTTPLFGCFRGRIVEILNRLRVGFLERGPLLSCFQGKEILCLNQLEWQN